jgi:uronate dehydrogenase
VIYGASDNTTSWWDNTPAKHIGYRPRDSAEPFRAALEAKQPRIDPTDPVAKFQGGGFCVRGPY